MWRQASENNPPKVALEVPKALFEEACSRNLNKLLMNISHLQNRITADISKVISIVMWHIYNLIEKLFF